MKQRPRWRTATSLMGLAALGASMLGLATPASAAMQDLGYDTTMDKGSLWQIKEVVGANRMHDKGFTGKGVGVAVIDTGVNEVAGLDSGNVWHGADLSFDSQDPKLAHRDAFGHGTHIASIIAGRDTAGTPASYTSTTGFFGVAPDVNLLSVKVGGRDGGADVSQMVAAIDWVVAHRNDNNLNVKVINLSYGTDSTQSVLTDPLIYAAERAWKAGIVVVAAAGNDGTSSQLLANPARSPFVLAVGATDTQGTTQLPDDAVPAWAVRGTTTRHVDVLAPGVSVVGLRTPNGYIDERVPAARVGTRFARATGTSQATAVVSGEVALLLQAKPSLTPDQVKSELADGAFNSPGQTDVTEGAGTARVYNSWMSSVQAATQTGTWGTGTGTLDGARGSSRVDDGIKALSGEVDIFGKAWSGSTWAASSAKGTAWSGGKWRGVIWTGSAWTGRTFNTVVWPNTDWAGQSWITADYGTRDWVDGAWVSSTDPTGTSTSNDWEARTWAARTWLSTVVSPAGWYARTWG
jgi:serine protease AprX